MVKKLEEKYFDVVVIGGGPAGMMAAISACDNNVKIALVEKSNLLGKKLLLTGNGRCNLTQANYSNREFIEKIGSRGKFLFSSLSLFGPKETINFFEEKGMPVKIESDGRVFPQSDKAADVLQTLTEALEKNGIIILLGQNIFHLEIINGKVEYIQSTNCKIYARQFILATGGKSYPLTGSTGDGYQWLKKAGHTITPLRPALVPIKVTEQWAKSLQGISLENVRINLIKNNKKYKLESGKIIFTHFGLSGPAIINGSKIIGQYLEKNSVPLEIDLLPEFNIYHLEEKIKKDFETNNKKNLKTYLAEFFPLRLVQKIMELAEMREDQKIFSLNKKDRTNIVRLIKGMPITVEALLDFNQAMITSGGVNLKEVDPKTMRSKIISNLFLAGEILDLDGPTGGYNLQIAWTTGHIAGTNAIDYLI